MLRASFGAGPPSDDALVIYFQNPDTKEYFRINCADRSMPPMTRHELRLVLKHLNKKCLGKIDMGAIEQGRKELIQQENQVLAKQAQSPAARSVRRKRAITTSLQQNGSPLPHKVVTPPPVPTQLKDYDPADIPNFRGGQMSKKHKAMKRNGDDKVAPGSIDSKPVKGEAPALQGSGEKAAPKNAEPTPDAKLPVNGESPVAQAPTDPAPVDRRIAVQMPCFVNTPTTSNVLNKLEKLLTFPKQDRMPCILILGDSNSGKTRILKKFWEKHPLIKDPADHQDRRPVIYFEVGGPGEGRFFDEALKGLGVTPALSHNPRQKEQQFLTHCIKQGVKALLIDEFHNGIHASSREQLKLLVRVRHLTNVLQIPIVVAGTEDAKTFLFSDPQLSSRFVIQERVPRWQEGNAYRGFLRGLEAKYQLKKPSKLAESGTLAGKILDMTEGLTGEIVRLLQASAELAVETGEEQITEKLLDSVIWTKPSERRL